MVVARENPMRMIRLEKITLNMGAGEPGPKLEKSKKILESIVSRKAVITKTHKRTTFGGAKNRPIGVKITLRGTEARDLLKRLLKAVEKLKGSNFDSSGNFSFGIHEYINIPGIKYDPDVGILGLDVAVTLERPGFRVKKRMIKPAKIGERHKIKPEEAMDWAKKEFGVKIEE